ncbi:hypothetical protein CEP51_014519 [Fusarium floridanum]|uniref:FAD-dependent oxidoreductase 2 FAD-binding domain-containing protein n=1 Tax=Fusarium floridanum TaxID=1325733 RepID=A0A428PRF5_9HYPO|nr:hypothetical protein CEP51_014519 [Fusarium floridanum]
MFGGARCAWRPAQHQVKLLRLIRPRSCLQHRLFATIQEKPKYDEWYDVVVVGSGAAGLSAAVTAAKKCGLKVLVTEKTGYFGGTSAYSGGALWIPGHKHQESLGFGKDTREDATTYLKSNLGDLYNEDRIQAYLKTGPEMVDWLEAETAVRFFGAPQPDYQHGLPGSAFGRVVLNQQFDGRRLGSMVKKIRYPMQGMSAFGTMQASMADFEMFKRPFSSFKNFGFVTRHLLRYASDYLRYGKGTVLCNGNALVGSLVLSNMQQGTTFWNNAVVTQLVEENGKASGVVVEKHGKPVKVQAKKGIVLASGGFGRSKELMSKYNTLSQNTAGPRGNTGDGMRLGQQLGGRLPPPLVDNALYSSISEYHPKKGTLRRFPHAGFDRPKPGYIIVDTDGKRFANEAEPYQTFGQHMKEAKVTKAWRIGDHQAVRKYGMGVSLPWPYPMWHLTRTGYFKKGKTIKALADNLGLDAKSLASTVNRFNEHARQGKDPDFHRGEHPFDNSYGDFSHKPNVNLRPLEKGPFYAVALYPGNLSTLYGLDTNKDAQVLNDKGNAIPGLYAAGADQNSVMMGKYPGGGSCLGPAMVFGYRAAMHMASH